MVEPRGAEAVAQAERNVLVVAEHDPFEHRSSIAVQPGRNGAREPRPEPIGHSTEPTSPPHGLPAVHAQDHVHAAAAEPGPFVEAVRRGARQGEDAERLELRALRWRAAEWKLEQNGFVRPKLPEAQHEPGRTERERPTPRRARDHDERPLGAPHFGEEDAAVESVEARASPPPPGESQGNGQEAEPPVGRRDARACEQSHGCRRERDGRGTNRIRGRYSSAERAEEQVVREARTKICHGATSPRSWSIFAGPIPGIASSSSTDENVPCWVR